MPTLPIGFGGEQLISLVHLSVAQSTWCSHGKVWGEGSTLVGDRKVVELEAAWLEVTTDYFLSKQESGVSAAVTWQSRGSHAAAVGCSKFSF